MIRVSLFEPRNAKDLSNRIVQIVRDYEAYSKKAAEFAKTIRDRYDWDSIFGRYNEVYMSVN